MEELYSYFEENSIYIHWLQNSINLLFINIWFYLKYFLKNNNNIIKNNDNIKMKIFEAKIVWLEERNLFFLFFIIIKDIKKD